MDCLKYDDPFFPSKISLIKGCLIGPSELSNIKFDVFENSFYSDEELKFTLCGRELKEENIGTDEVESSGNDVASSEQEISKSYEQDYGEATHESIAPKVDL